MTVTPMFPLEVAMLPGEKLPLRIFEPRYAALVGDCLSAVDPAFGVVLIAAGREVGGGDERCNIGALARIVECGDFGGGRYRLRCVMGERIRVLHWLDDDPYPRASVEVWPDDPGDRVTVDQLSDVEDRIIALFERIAAVRNVELPARSELLGEVEPGDDAGSRLYALAARVPMGQADRYSVLSAPTSTGRLDALSEAVDTVTAMVEFQLSGE
ncbi:MAG: LON peptidase substrate-binding domain-containing protein [Mycobacterium sp.]